MKYRGVLIDISRGPVPTLETLRDAIDTVAEFKMNQVYFHMQDSFHSLRQPLIGLLSDTVSQDEWRKLIAYASEQYVDIIAEQESCGHCTKSCASRNTPASGSETEDTSWLLRRTSGRASPKTCLLKCFPCFLRHSSILAAMRPSN